MQNEDQASNKEAPFGSLQEPAEPSGGQRSPHLQPFRKAVPVLAITGLFVAGSAASLWWEASRHFETTDDAFVAARSLTIAPKISGYLSSVKVTDNQHVDRGQLIAQIDDQDYQVALQQATAQVNVSRAAVKSAEAQISAQEAQVEEANAEVAASTAALQLSKQNFVRYGDLLRSGATTVQKVDEASSDLKEKEASLSKADAAEHASQNTLNALISQKNSAVAQLSLSEAELAAANLNLSYTKIIAMQPGHVVQLSASVGQYTQTGAALASFVPDDLWIVANFKESQLEFMKVGDSVDLSIDAYPELQLKGKVESIQAGSGTAFALLPTENATGNYVKVVQRVPVKITLVDPPPGLVLGPGMSAVPKVRIDERPTWLELLGRWT